MKISLKLLESNQQIQLEILQTLLPDIRSWMDNAVKHIKQHLPDLIKQSILLQPEYESLSNGSLKYELGIPDIENKIAELFNIWISNMQIKYIAPKISGSQIKSTFSASMIKADFSDVLGSSAAEIVDEQSGSVLPWLQWLLLDGTATIIKDYSVILGKNNRSRTGYAIMRPSQDSWHVPNEFSGTSSNNWITRAIDSAADDINQLIERALK